jgi:hypothetical protein
VGGNVMFQYACAQHNAVISTFRHVGYLRPGYRLGKSGRESRQGQSIFSFPKCPHIYGGHASLLLGGYRFSLPGVKRSGAWN